MWYARQVANYPCYVIFIILTGAILFIILSVTQTELPNFKDPLLGFESRGTDLSKRATAWHNLLKSTSWDGPLTFYPGSIVTDISNETIEAAQWRQSSSKNGTPAAESSGPWLEFETDEQNYGSLHKEDDSGRIVFERPPSPNIKLTKIPTLEGKNFFCNNPSRDYAHVIMQSSSGKNLLTVEGLKSICDVDENKLRKSDYFSELCEQSPVGSCCRSWSISNYVALLRNLSTCHAIGQSDVNAVLELLVSCASYYHNMKLSHDCAMDPALCRGVPRHCIEYDAVYNILHYLTDINFLNPKHPPTPQLTYTAVFLPIAQSSAALNYYEDLESEDLCSNDVVVAGMEFGLKYRLFTVTLQNDAVYVVLAGMLIFFFLWIYSSSFFVTFMTLCGVVFSMATAYFMYSLVYQIKFFPFINLLTVIIIIGIGADDACIYCKIWSCAKAEKSNGTLVKLVCDTFHHACLSMLVTSITTAAAFFGSMISNITAVRCFSIFAGTAVLANFFFTISWLPASVTIAEKWCSSTCLLVSPLGLYLPQFQHIPWFSSLCNSFWKIHYSFTDSSRVFFEKILPCIIVKSRYFWLVLFTTLATGAAVVVFYYPRLQLPDSKEFQLFKTEHPFEQYDLYLKKFFWFEKAREQDVFRKLPIRIVWGVLPVDTGDYLDPYDRGALSIDPLFDMAQPEAQLWLYKFCTQLRNQTFYQLTSGPLLFNCFIETFRLWMERRCVDGITDANRTPCCESSKFPFSVKVFNYCIKQAVGILHHNPGYFAVPVMEGVRFSKSTAKVQAIVVQYDSIYSYSNSYTEMYEFSHSVDGWVSGMLKTAPDGLKNGWFVSDLEFFDLQDSLSRGTVIAIGVAIAVSFIALLLTTLNLLMSIYAIVTIACIIIVTVASLVLLGWKLNVLESTTVSIAIGLAVDLTLHYAVAYKLSPQEDRESSVVFALSHVGSPVAMAAFTTFMAGALIFPSTVLAYLQIGTFLVLLMSISWLYSTFFFLSILSIAGPVNEFLQLSYSSFNVCSECETAAVPVEKNVFALSESTLSSSSASYPNQIPTSESHELEPLTAIKAGHIDVPKFKKKYSHRSIRPRSESLSSAPTRTRDSAIPFKMSKTPRKISLPTVSVTFHGEPNPDSSIGGATSSSTIVCADEEREPLSKDDVSDSWIGKEISL
ncbi:protein dispatched homolog 1 isoform X1 [Parasteatoda tepidariorum]|uniref:protein dispatched homolog 1 isoform X1 n=1 Tax=Parasteatoda tepidariorum TaxID=114398 RepID=UPI001C727701|nr:protein dispatched isoform X1 [Parasteatoda tepidariorum]XP_015919111.2 protein dispatched isoform X1 [Parasteatoda tepidariorum]XP_015919124.2 protein dispatched isoform X1 [Parasteatoda tepidariorum]